jgi:uncharacterized protein
MSQTTGTTSSDTFVCEAANNQKSAETGLALLKYLLAGMFFGILLIKAEVMSWYRIQEMFRLASFHMYGVIGSAVVTGAVSVWIMKKTGARTLSGEAPVWPVKTFHRGQVIGGLVFGLGWGITGACPGPIFAQIGAGFPAALLTLAGAVAGTWVYGKLLAKH